MRQSELYSDYKKARDTAWKVIFKYQIGTLPVDVKKLCDDMGLVLHSYKTGATYIKACRLERLAEENDGFVTIIKNNYVVFINEKALPPGRLRFTVAHEIYHVLNGDLETNNAACRSGVSLWNRTGEEPNPIEAAANVFASRLLAPACVLHALGIHTADDIAILCGLSNTAAEIRAKRMAELYNRERDWLKTKGYSCFGASPRERKALEQFREFINSYNTGSNRRRI